MASINAKMIVLARESRNSPQNSLAKKLGISPSKLSKIETGLMEPSEDLLDKLSVELGYPKDFFFLREEIYGLGISGMGAIYYRRRKSISMLVLNAIQARINIRRIHISRLLKSVDIDHTRDMPYIDIDEYDGDAFEIARAIRAMWRIPNGPIESLTKIIESAGGIVIKCNFDSDKIDALSQPGSPPLFYVNRNSPGDRLRFSLAHELGHIIMHRVPNPNMEKEANQFASEFLMPEHEIAPYLKSINLQRLASLKPYWKVAMAALLYRASEVDSINKRKYQYLWTQMAPYRKREPKELDIPVEQPELLNNIIQIYLKELNFSLSDISRILHLFEEEARELYVQEMKTPYLRIVKGKKRTIRKGDIK